MGKKISTIQLIRRITLGVLLIGMTALTVLHQKMRNIPSIDALDPFGGLETMMKFLAGGEFIKKIEPGNIVLFAGIVVLGFLVSRFFCGWFCAFGALQGVFGWIGKKIFRRRFIVPVKLDRVLRWMKYPALIVIIALTWSTGELIIRPYDPLAAYGHISAGPAALMSEFAVGSVILIIVLLLSALYERVFCKYLCPLGAFNAILSRIPIFRIKRKASTCISCSKCDKVCSMNVEVSKSDTINSPECISCMECVTACPTPEKTLVTTFWGKTLRTGTIVIIGFALFAGAALIGQATGMLHFTAQSLQSKAKTGSLNITDIKGSSTYESIAEGFGIELDRLYGELGLDIKKVPANTMLKDTGKVAGIDGFTPDTVRFAVAKILGISYAGETEGGEAMTIEQSEPKPVEKTGTVTRESILTVPADFNLEGTMSIQDIATELNVPTNVIIKKLGIRTDIPVDQPLRDLKDQYGYSMSDLKTRIKQ
jgi:hypothetical protein